MTAPLWSVSPGKRPPRRAAAAPSRRWMTSRSPSTMARRWPSWGPRAAARARCCAWWPGWRPLDSGQVYTTAGYGRGQPPKDRGIGMVFQSYALYPHMKGEGNLGFFFKVRNRPTEEMMERIRITSEIMGIGFEHLLARKPGTLSGGQQQRVAIGRCIVRDPSLFLFDEPLSNLDAKLRTSHARRDQAPAAPLSHHGHLCHPRPDRGHHPGRPHRRDARRARSSSWAPIRRSPSDPANVVCGRLSGVAAHEPAARLAWPRPMARWTGPMGMITCRAAWPLASHRDRRSRSAFAARRRAWWLRGATPERPCSIAARCINAEPNFARAHQLVNVESGERLFGVAVPLDEPRQRRLAGAGGWCRIRRLSV